MCAIQIVIIVLLGVFKIIGKEFKVRDRVLKFFACLVVSFVLRRKVTIISYEKVENML